MKEQYPGPPASRQGMQEAIATDDELLREVEEIEQHLRGPLLDALRRATRAERAAILTGLSTLRRLLTAAEG